MFRLLKLPMETLPALAAVGALAGCAVGSDYVRPQVDTGSGWSEAPPAAQASVDLATWWRSFDDPTLNRLIDQALGQSFDVREAGARIAEARALRDAAAGGRAPRVDVAASVTRRRQSENGPLPIDRIPGLERDQTVHEPNFDAVWEADLFGGRRRRIEAADARLGMVVERQRAARLSVAAETARDYFALRGAQHELEARRAAAAATRRSTELVHMRFAAGDVPRAAVAQADAELAAIEAQVPPLEARVRTAALSIGVVLGGLPESELRLASRTDAYLPLAPVPVGERADLLRRRPDVRAAERALAAATADAGAATAELFPKLTLAATGGFQSLATGTLLESASEVGSLVPLISWRLFAGGRIRAEIRASNARVEAAAVDYERAVKSALLDAETALTRYGYGLAAVDLQGKAVAAARTSYGYADMRYRSGDISLLQLLDAERVLRDAEDAYARTHTQAATDLVALFKALGGGWEIPAGRQ